ncbi:MAG: alpha/beta hydrolase [Xenococcaceae cyanobacterium]
MKVAIQNVKVEPIQDTYYPVRLTTSRGHVNCRYYSVPGTGRGAIWVGGVGGGLLGGWDSPAKGLYPRLCQELIEEGIASLRVRYRYENIPQESIFDVRTGLSYLENEGIKVAALIGHSFGGTVVIQSATMETSVSTVVTLATQRSAGSSVSGLAPQCSLLLLHGTADKVLPAFCSEYVYKLAHQPKRLILYEGAGHNLDEVSEAVRQVVRDWIVQKLN